MRCLKSVGFLQLPSGMFGIPKHCNKSFATAAFLGRGEEGHDLLPVLMREKQERIPSWTQ
jgi:hypothetical protein